MAASVLGPVEAFGTVAGGTEVAIRFS